MNEVVEQEALPAALVDRPTTPAGLLELAVQRGASIEQMQALMVIKREWDADEARKAFAADFAAFKAEAVDIIRNKEFGGPLTGKKYADLYAVTQAVTPALSKHGLSVSWKPTKDDKDWIEITCMLRHKGGHVETVSMGGPPDTGGAKNMLQARCSTKTSLERATTTAILGVASRDADDDGAGGAPAVMVKGVLAGLLADVAKAADDAAAVALWNTGKKTLASLGDQTATDEFKSAIVARRTVLKGGV